MGVPAVAPCRLAPLVGGGQHAEALAALDADGMFFEQAVFDEGVDALAGGEGVAAETMLDQIAHADDAKGGHVIEGVALALGHVDAVAGADAAHVRTAAGAGLRVADGGRALNGLGFTGDCGRDRLCGRLDGERA